MSLLPSLVGYIKDVLRVKLLDDTRAGDADVLLGYRGLNVGKAVRVVADDA